MRQQPRIQIFLLNGPPNSGKDSLADIINNNDRTFGKMKLAFPIKEANKAFWCLTDQQYNLFEHNRNFKEKKQDILMGKSWRQVNIDFAEEFIKKIYGSEAFGHILVNRIKQIKGPKMGFNVIVSDCGFTDEIKPLIEAFGKENIHVIKLQRKNCTFENDSRGYVDCDELEVGEYFLRNKGAESTFHQNGFRLIQAIKAGNLPQTTPFSEKTEKTTKKTSTKTKTSKAKK